MDLLENAVKSLDALDRNHEATLDNVEALRGWRPRQRSCQIDPLA